MLTSELLTALVHERISFDDFEARTRDDLTALATKLMAGRQPPTVQVEDLVQEMLLAVHVKLPAFDPTRGDIKRFIVWEMCVAAKAALRRGRHWRHYDTTQFTQVVRNAALPVLEHADAMQEAARLAGELLKQLPNSDRQRAVMTSLARTWSLDATTAELLRHPDTKAMFGTDHPQHARRTVYKVARKLAQRAAATG